jgi:hypothetical protein
MRLPLICAVLPDRQRRILLAALLCGPGVILRLEI